MSRQLLIIATMQHSYDEYTTLWHLRAMEMNKTHEHLYYSISLSV